MTTLELLSLMRLISATESALQGIKDRVPGLPK